MDRQGKKTNASEFRHYILIQRKGELTTDGEGGFEDAWSDVESTWAAVYPVRAQQLFEYRSINVEATHIIKVRGETDIVEADRVSFDSRYFEILTVENIQERCIEKVATCKELK
jgi:SPP1 family predicted phage head-tail adaptor